MEIIYYIINFGILVGLVVLIGRKTIISMFRDRRTRIEDDLTAAEHPAEIPAEFDELPEITEQPETAGETPESILAELNRKKDRLREYAESECREISLSKLEKERKAVLAAFREKTAESYKKSNSAQAEEKYDAALMNDILAKLRLNPGDMLNLKERGFIEAVLSSAKELPEPMVKRAQKAVEALLAANGGRAEFRTELEPGLIGGFRLRLGDTTYDGSVSEFLYRITKEVEDVRLTEKDSEKTLLGYLDAAVRKTERRCSRYQQGRVISVSDGICWMDGLGDIMFDEVVEFECGERGMVLDIRKDRVGCVVFGSYEHIESGSRVRRVGQIASVPVGKGMLGRVVDAVGNPIDGKGFIKYKETRPIEAKAPGILERSAVSRPLHTGIKAVDAMVPIGKGQRELLIGDRQTGKTAIVRDAIINQKGKNVVCIYVGIGQKETTIASLREKLEEYGAADYTVIVSGSASDSAAMQYIAPFAATAIGEYFMYTGRDVLIIYDDLSKHAVAYRELSLLLQRPSGREAYPGDIFYLHSRLLERSAQLSDKLGGGSMTALPIIETQAGDISSYIPTNVISITDGQIFLEGELFHAGQRPAVNVGLSVSRVGGAAQTKLLKQVSSDLRTKLAQYRELAEFTQFGADMDEETRKTLNNGERLTEALKQACYAPLEDWNQALLLFAVSNGFTDETEVSRLKEFEGYLFDRFEKDHPELADALKTGEKMNAGLRAQVEEAITAAVKEF